MNNLSLEQFQKNVPKAVFDIADKLKENGYSAYLVGGSVRDLLLDRTVHDFDIATNAVPDILLDIFPKSIEVGVKFGTVIVVSSPLGLEDTSQELEEYQVTTFRKDAEYINGRWPSSVTFSETIEEDLSRRDFTINAFAINLLTIHDEESFKNSFIDLFGGLNDLEHGIIRAVGLPIERMKEDGLRALRACRFAAQLGFTIDTDTFDAIIASSTTVDQISMERIRDEFVKTVLSPTPSIGLELMRRAGLLQKFIPEILEGVDMEQNSYHEYDLYTHLLMSCERAPQRVRLVSLLHDIGKSRTKDGEHFYGHEEVGAIMAEEILNRLKFPKKDMQHIIKLIRLHMFNYSKEWGDAAVRRFMQKVGDDETLHDLFLLRLADVAGNPKSEYDPSELKELERRIQKIREEDNALSIKDLRINGYDLMDIGIKDGRKIGETLQKLLDAVIEDPTLNTKDRLLDLSKKVSE